MTAHTDPAARKKAIIDRLMSLEEQELATAQAHYDAFLKDSQLDDREGHDKDDIAASRENADLAAAFDAPVHAHHASQGGACGIHPSRSAPSVDASIGWPAIRQCTTP